MGGDDKTAKPTPDGDDAKNEGGEGASAAVSHKPATPLLPNEVIVHPLVLLSVVDHYNRVAKDTRKRVVGVLLGESYKARAVCALAF